MLTTLFVYLSITQLPKWALSDYTPPMAKVEPLYPRGIRISIPDEEGISLVAFHVRINEEFEGLEAGTIARDVLRARDGRWKYEDNFTQLKFGDKVYYWVHVVYQGLGYNLLFQQHEVTGFFNPDGSRINAEGGSSPAGTSPTGASGCQLSETIIMSTDRRAGGSVCKGALIFEDEFNTFNISNWRILTRFSRPPDYPFVVYRDDPKNVKTEGGTLRITPTLLELEYGRDFIRHGGLTLPRCTAEPGSTDCRRDARGRYIIPPVAASVLDTEKSLIFQYGIVEIRAKLPKGDWLYPIIALESANGPDDPPIRKQIRIVESLGNAELTTKSGADISGHVISGGPIAQLNPEDNGRSTRPQRYSSSLWSDDYHNYEVEWRKNLIRLKVDGTEYGNVKVDSAFDKPFYLTLAVGAGSHTEFPDRCKSGNHQKPWKNVGSRALFNFFDATEQWSPTWEKDSKDLIIDYVKIKAL